MRERETGESEGAAAERQRRRKWWTLLGVALAAGFGTGFGVALTEEGGAFGDGRIPEWLAIGATVVYLATMIVGTVMMKRFTDELEMHNNIFGLAVGASALLLVYPPWLMLWRGGLVGEPSHGALFLAMFLPAMATYLWKKYR
jgi:drug/metabolite transporter (DMT)-like permease